MKIALIIGTKLGLLHIRTFLKTNFTLLRCHQCILQLFSVSGTDALSSGLSLGEKVSLDVFISF